MPRYEYKVVPAPTKGLRSKGVKGPQNRFAYAVQELMNGLSGYGWEYQRAETLPSTERSGLTGSTTEWRNVLVFRRLRESDAETYAAELLPAPLADDGGEQSEPDITPAPPVDAGSGAPGDTPTDAPEDAPDDAPAKDTLEEDNIWDNGVENTNDVKSIALSLEKLVEARKAAKSDS